jgi:hypothetical protein
MPKITLDIQITDNQQAKQSTHSKHSFKIKFKKCKFGNLAGLQ